MYKTILVHVDETTNAVHRIDIAARLAMANDAHLIGTAATGFAPYLFPFGGFEAGVPAIVFPIEQLQAAADSALDKFDAAASRAGISTFERRRIDEEAGPGISMLSRYADVVVLGQADAASSLLRMPSDLPEYVLLNCPRPVLMVPAAGIGGAFGQRIAVAWNGSVEAARAIASAIPMLQRADQVDLVLFNPEMEGELHGPDPGADMAIYLARHNVRIELNVVETDADPGEALLSYAADSNADLIVMGAYGHSRFREIILGGATRSMLISSPLPLWMAH